MSSEEKRQTDLAELHPAIRDHVRAVRDALNAEGFTFEVFEAYRTPQRQAYLFAQGRTRPGNIVTKARSWTSYHQYGLATDFVLRTDGQWDWSDSGAKAAAWRRLHEIGKAHGLEPLSWEAPHLQMAGLQIGDLRAGRFPPGGDESWADNLEANIAGWTGDPPAPPPPTVNTRPPLPADVITSEASAMSMTADTDNDMLDRPAVPTADSANAATNFALVQPFIEKWEGGFVDNPADPGGATNMGITMATLARWRGRAVTKAEVQALTREEARRIFKANYFDVVRAGDVPPRIAAVLYNAAVLHGPKRSAEWLQTAAVRQGATITVDGAIGPQTLAAVATIDAGRAVTDFLAGEEAFLRSLPHFPVFGKGWLNRLADLKAFVATLAAGDVPLLIGGPIVTTTASAPDLQSLLKKAAELIALIKPVGGGGTTPPAPSDVTGQLSTILDILGSLGIIDPTVLPKIKQPLTSVNAALGQTIGNALDGKKTAIGVIGSLLATIGSDAVNQSGLATTVLGLLPAAQPYLLPLSLALTGWGVLGKLDKWRPKP